MSKSGNRTALTVRLPRQQVTALGMLAKSFGFPTASAYARAALLRAVREDVERLTEAQTRAEEGADGRDTDNHTDEGDTDVTTDRTGSEVQLEGGTPERGLAEMSGEESDAAG